MKDLLSPKAFLNAKDCQNMKLLRPQERTCQSVGSGDRRMNELEVLVSKHSEMIHEFSSRCIGRIAGYGPLKVLLVPFHRFLEANVEKEIDKDRLIIDWAVAAYHNGTDLNVVSREELFEETKRADAEFLKKVSLPSMPDVRYHDLARIRKIRINVMFGTVYDLMKNWKGHHSFSETVRKTYSPEQFSETIIDILHLYRLETKVVADSIELPPPAKKVKDLIEPKLYEVMERVAEEIAKEYTKKIFAVAAVPVE